MTQIITQIKASEQFKSCFSHWISCMIHIITANLQGEQNQSECSLKNMLFLLKKKTCFLDFATWLPWLLGRIHGL